MDITDSVQLQRACETTLDAYGKVDVLINNGAMRMNHILPSGRINALDIESRHWERMFKINVLGVVETIRIFAQPMIQQNRGSIINISSSSGDRPGGGDAPYSSSKAALTSLTRSLAIELKTNNIAVNAVYPSAPRTTGYDEQAGARKAMGMRVPPPSRPEAMVPLVLLLAQQDANDGLTGRVLSAVDWNLEHGLGGPEKWVSPEE
jgi:NAD(P)-dependent dehydrogenase (short-subunit alcohol dehydrogenase family)